MFIETAGPATGIAPAGPAGLPVNRRPKRRALSPYLYILPAVVLLLVWTYWPLGQTVNLSFNDWNLIPTKPKQYVDVQKYAKVLSLPELHQALHQHRRVHPGVPGYFGCLAARVRAALAQGPGQGPHRVPGPDLRSLPHHSRGQQCRLAVAVRS